MQKWLKRLKRQKGSRNRERQRGKLLNKTLYGSVAKSHTKKTLTLGMCKEPRMMEILMSNLTREGKETKEIFLKAPKFLPQESDIETGSRKTGQGDGTEI